MTFTVVARDPESGLLGIAQATNPLSVGARCPFIRADVGAVSTQAYGRTDLRVDFAPRKSGEPDAVELLRRAFDQYRPMIPYYKVRPRNPSLSRIGSEVRREEKAAQEEPLQAALEQAEDRLIGEENDVTRADRREARQDSAGSIVRGRLRRPGAWAPYRPSSWR